MKQTGQFKIIKNGSSVNFEHQVTFIFTKQDKTNFTRSTNTKGAWDFDVPNGEYFISAFLTQSEEKKTEQFRGGLLFIVNAQTKVTALDDWINGNADGKDPLYEQWLKLMQDTQKAAKDAELARDEIKDNSVGNGKYMRTGAGGLLDRSNILETQGDFHALPILTQFFSVSGNWINSPFGVGQVAMSGVCSTIARRYDAGTIFRIDLYANRRHFYKELRSGNWSNWHENWNSENTAVDTNGFIKKASPIIKLFDDHIEHNDQFKEEPIFEKIDVGTYKISNTLGLSREGWTYEKPRGSDGNPYFRILVEKLEGGCIVSVHDEYESIEKAEIIDAEGNKRIINRVVKILGQKRDIKEHERWIDLRFHEEIEEYEEQEMIE